MIGAPSDAELVLAARSGRVHALGTLLERHHAGLYAAALAILHDRAEAQDAVQDTFITALRRLDDLREPEAVAGWLRSILRNACRMRVRARREIPVEVEPPPAPDEAEEAVDRLAVRDWVWETLERLPEEQRATVMLRFFTSVNSYESIAAVLGVPVGTVRSRLNHAKQRLATVLLHTAGIEHRDHLALTERRRREWQEIVGTLHASASGDLYAAECAGDVLVEAPAQGYRTRGIGDHRRDVEQSAAAGVKLHLREIVASAGVTIVHGEFENPPDDPDHCPAAQTEVRFHPRGRTTRVLLYYPPRAAAGR